MILGLPAIFYDSKASVDIPGGACDHIEILGGADVVGAAAGDQNAAGTQHLERPQVELFVAAKGSFQAALVLGEGGRIEHDGVVPASGVGVVPQQVEGVGFDPFDLTAVERTVAVGYLQRGAR